MEIKEIISYFLNPITNVLDISFRTIEDSEEVLRTDNIDYTHVEDYGFDLVSESFDFFDEDFADDEILEGEDKIELDEEELISKTPEEGFTNVMEPKVLKIIGESYSDKGCVGLDYKNDVDYSETVDGLFADGLQAASESKNHLLGILLCERDGKIEDTP